MLRPEEKAYCRALFALQQKEYARAEAYFAEAASRFETNAEFTLLRETNRVLLAVRKELGKAEPTIDDDLVIEEAFTRG